VVLSRFPTARPERTARLGTVLKFAGQGEGGGGDDESGYLAISLQLPSIIRSTPPVFKACCFVFVKLMNATCEVPNGGSPKSMTVGIIITWVERGQTVGGTIPQLQRCVRAACAGVAARNAHDMTSRIKVMILRFNMRFTFL
jgi:hypothetical protein